MEHSVKLEMVLDKERLQKRLDILQGRFPALVILTKTSFFVIVGCYLVGPLAAEEKAWLQLMIDELVIHRYRAKEREDR